MKVYRPNSYSDAVNGEDYFVTGAKIDEVPNTDNITAMGHTILNARMEAISGAFGRVSYEPLIQKIDIPIGILRISYTEVPRDKALKILLKFGFV